MRLLRTIRLDPSDTFLFENAAEPGEWAVSGAFMFAGRDPALFVGKPRAAFRGGFLGLGSFGWSTLVQIVDATEAERGAAVELLAARLVQYLGAPDLATARPAAEEEIAFAASLCDHPIGRLAAVSRRVEDGKISEAFRTLRPGPSLKPTGVFSFIEAPDEDNAPMERIEFAVLAKERP
jgi:hypothetical protein